MSGSRPVFGWSRCSGGCHTVRVSTRRKPARIRLRAPGESSAGHSKRLLGDREPPSPGLAGEGRRHAGATVAVGAEVVGGFSGLADLLRAATLWDAHVEAHRLRPRERVAQVALGDRTGQVGAEHDVEHREQRLVAVGEGADRPVVARLDPVLFHRVDRRHPPERVQELPLVRVVGAPAHQAVEQARHLLPGTPLSHSVNLRNLRGLRKERDGLLHRHSEAGGASGRCRRLRRRTHHARGARRSGPSAHARPPVRVEVPEGRRHRG